MRDETIMLSMAALLIIAICFFAALGASDYTDEIVERQHYCEMTALWLDNLHLAPEERPGWPPYRGECENEH